MTKIYVDELRETVTSQRWPYTMGCHMIAAGGTPEENSAELHAMAKKMSLRKEWVQQSHSKVEHFDLNASKRREAIALGAQPVSSIELLRMKLKGK